jgi:L-amino acid N-acyltransferase YncA
MNFKISIAQKSDLPKIVDIYNWAIENTTATFDTETKTVEERLEWFEEHDQDFPLIVVKDKNQEVIGWGCLSRWSDRRAYDVTAEVSFYIAPVAHGRGLGSLILQELIRLGKETRKKTLISRVTKESEVSLHLHKKYGFEQMGVMKNCGIKFEKLLDVHFLQYLY